MAPPELGLEGALLYQLHGSYTNDQRRRAVTQPGGDVGAEDAGRARQRQTNASARVDIAARGIHRRGLQPAPHRRTRPAIPDVTIAPPVLRFQRRVPEPPPHLLDAQAAVVHQRMRAAVSRVWPVSPPNHRSGGDRAADGDPAAAR